jgi:hypothetical protein
MIPNSKIQALIKSMGIVPESEHYEIAERVIKECMNLAYEYDAPKMSGPGMIIASRIESHFGVEEK